MRPVEAHALADAELRGAVQRERPLLRAERDAAQLALGVLGEVEQVAPPAAADVEHALAGPDVELLARSRRTCAPARRRGPRRGRANMRRRVAEARVEDELEDLRVMLVVLGDPGALVLALLGRRAPRAGGGWREAPSSARRSGPARARSARRRSAGAGATPASATSGARKPSASSSATPIWIIPSESTPRSASSSWPARTAPPGTSSVSATTSRTSAAIASASSAS